MSERAALKAFEALSKNRQLFAGSGKFTHKCSCPNPEHKSGSERTPSFYFSKETGQFFCFGCQAYGDAFDLISLLGGSAKAAMDAAIADGPIEIPDMPDVHKVIESGLIKLTKKCRDILISKIGTIEEQDAKIWFGKFFSRLDSMTLEMESETSQQIGGRFLQLNMEITRRWK